VHITQDIIFFSFTTCVYVEVAIKLGCWYFGECVLADVTVLQALGRS